MRGGPVGKALARCSESAMLGGVVRLRQCARSQSRIVRSMPVNPRLDTARLAWSPDGAVGRNYTLILRGLRLTTGLILFTFATCHLLNHAFGIRSTAAMQAASEVLLAPWQSLPGLWLLYGAFITHATLGLMALYRRRHLRMPAAEA